MRRKPNSVSFAAGRQCRWSTCMERENLDGDAKAQVTQTARPKVPMRRAGADRFVVVRHRLCRPTANETLLSHCRVVGIELRRRVCFFVVLKRGNARGANGAGHRHLARVNRQREEPDVQWKAAAFARWHEPDDARVSSPVL